MRKYSNISNRIKIKILGIIANIFILLALVEIAKTSPVRGFEISIYNGFSSYLWLFIFISATCGFIILLMRRFENSNWWLIGFWVIIFSNVIFLSLPFFRGYYIYPKGDALTHLGFIKDMLTNGHIGEDNFYPIVHLLGVNLIELSGLNREIISNILFVTWSLIYFLNMYLIGMILERTTKLKILEWILFFGNPLIFSLLATLLHPSILSIFMIPLVLYFYHKREISKSLENDFILIILAITITLTHPVTSIFLITIFIIFNVSKILYSKVINRDKYFKTDYYVLQIMLIVFFGWYFSYSFIKKSFQTAIYSLFFKNEVSLYNQQMDTLKGANFPVLETLKIFIFKYGGISIYLFISIIAIILLLKLNKKTLDLNSFTYIIQFIIAILFSAFSLFAFTGEYSIIRISRFYIVMSPIIIGLSISRYINDFHLSNNNRLLIFIILLTVLASIISIFNVYGSPRVVEQNWQVSKMETYGATWFENHQERKIITATIGVDLRRFEDLIFGYEYSFDERARLDNKVVQSHFGYNKNISVKNTFNFNDRYLLISESGLIAFQIIPESIKNSPEIHKARQYTVDDFVKLNGDSAISHIYSNGEFNTWREYGNNR